MASPVSYEFRIRQVRYGIVSTQGKAVAGKKELAPRSITHHPGSLQRCFSGEIQGALHGHAHWTSGTENGHALIAVVLGDLVEPEGNSAAKVGPGFDLRNQQVAGCPLCDYHFKQTLKSAKFFFAGGAVEEILVQGADAAVGFHKLRKTMLHYRFRETHRIPAACLFPRMRPRL